MLLSVVCKNSKQIFVKIKKINIMNGYFKCLIKYEYLINKNLSCNEPKNSIAEKVKQAWLSELGPVCLNRRYISQVCSWNPSLQEFQGQSTRFLFHRHFLIPQWPNWADDNCYYHACFWSSSEPDVPCCYWNHTWPIDCTVYYFWLENVTNICQINRIFWKIATTINWWRSNVYNSFVWNIITAFFCQAKNDALKAMRFVDEKQLSLVFDGWFLMFV